MPRRNMHSLKATFIYKMNLKTNNQQKKERQMKKRGGLIVLLVFTIIFTLINSNISSAGCCTPPEIQTCYDAVDSSVCPGYYNTEDCGTLDLCLNYPFGQSGCCIDTCTDNILYKATCPDYFEPNKICSETPECAGGCCTCVDTEDLTNNYCIFDTLSNCEQACLSRQLHPLFSSTISESECEDIPACESRTLPIFTLSGTITNTQGNAIQDVLITVQSLSDTSDSSGSYSLDFLEGEITITVTKSGYQTHTETITISQDTTLDITLIESIIGNTIKGTITGETDTTPSPLLGAKVTLKRGNIQISEIQTDNQGNYQFNSIDQGTYQLIVSKETYLQKTEEIDLTSQELIKDITLERKPVGTIKGTVTSNSDPVPFAKITFNAIESTLADVNGNYEIELPVGDYNIKAHATGYEPSTIYPISLGIWDTITRDITLIPLVDDCALGASRTVTNFQANHIPGEKTVKLTWNLPQNCRSTVLSYSIFRNQQKITTLPALTTHPTEYLDIETDWQTPYTYEIIVTYFDPLRNSSSAIATITTGYSECEGKYIEALNKFSEFCKTNFIRVTCDESNNNIIQLQDCSNENTDTNQNFLCSGPSVTGETYCRDVGACDPRIQNALPFGLYFQESSCYGVSNNNYCYFDYSNTIIDTCQSCSPDMTCYDYKSEQACAQDNCDLGKTNRCEWYSTVPTLGKGFCYQENYEQDKCHLCKEDNPLFSNIDCIQSVCDKLGDCFSDGSSCNSCGDYSKCEDYATELECTGNQEIEINNCIEDGITPSLDSCNLGKCKFGDHDSDSSTPNQCFKDGNNDNFWDCQNSQSCFLSDTTAPETSPLDAFIEVNKNSIIEFASDSDAQELWYCIDASNTCCPSESTDLQSDIGVFMIEPLESQTLNDSYFTQGNGDLTQPYYIRYYAIDSNENQEALKVATAIIDITPPSIDLKYLIASTTSEDSLGLVLSNLLLNITIGEQAYCTDSMTSTFGYDEQLIDESDSFWQNQYSLRDGTYIYEITCTDQAGNSNTKTLEIQLDEFPFAYVIHPLPSSTTQQTDIQFRVSTNAAGECEFYKGETKIGDFTSSTDKKTHTHIHTVPDNQNHKSYYAICKNESDKYDLVQFYFTVDNLAPATSIVYHVQDFEYIYSPGSDFWSDYNVSVSFICNETLPLSWGCSPNTKYCESLFPDSPCNPHLPAPIYPTKIDFTNTTTVCYQSNDLNMNQEEVKCSTIYIGEDFDIRLVNPPYSLSPIPEFDLIVERSGTEECRYSQIDSNVPFELLSEFEKVLGKPQYKIPNFNGFPPNNIFTEQACQNNNCFVDLYVKCKDTGGYINDDPVHFIIGHDPTPPIFEQAIADPNPIYQELETTLDIITDDFTICKYDRDSTDYNNMHGEFPGWKEYGSSDLSIDNFNKTHQATINLAIDDSGKTFTYNIACQNLAGEISTTSITFSVDFSDKGHIIDKSPSDFINYQKNIYLRVQTNMDALCTYDGHEFSSSTTTQHVSEPTDLEQGYHSFDIVCLFTDWTVSSLISFIIDTTSPNLKSVNMSTQTCYDDFLQPTFIAEDNVSDIDYYEYALYEADTDKLIINWTTTTSDNPQISEDHNGDSLNLTLGKKYYFGMLATDKAGNTQTTPIQSIDFELIDINSEICNSDNDPPSITISTESTYSGLKVIINCEDESGCDGKKYGLSEELETCTPTETYGSGVIINDNTKFCWNVSDMVGNIAIGSDFIDVTDTDGDGVLDSKDICPGTPYGVTVDIAGCPVAGDDDNDGVMNLDDLCPYTPEDEIDDVDFNGCGPSERDTDQDTVKDLLDKCPNTPSGETIDLDPDSEYYGCSDSQKFSCGDEIDDAWRKRYFGSVLCDGDGAFDADPDGDGLTNLEEYQYYRSTGRDISPKEKDTDGDGYDDNEEIIQQFDPTNPFVYPGKRSLLGLILILLGIFMIIGGSGYLTYMEYTHKPLTLKKPIKPVAPIKRPTPPPISKIQEERRKREIQEQKRRQEIFEKRRKEKQTKREKYFEKFGEEELRKKPEEKSIKEIPKKKTAPKKSRRKEFAKLAELTEKHITDKKPLADLIKKAKISPKRKEEFQKLAEIAKKQVAPKKTTKELTPEQRKEIKDIFYWLSELKPKQGTKPEEIKKLIKQRKTNTSFEELKKLSKKKPKKKKQDTFSRLKKLTKKK